MLRCGKSGNSDRSGSRRELRRWLADFVLALSLFWAMAFAVNGSDIRAHAVPLPTTSLQTIHSDVTTVAGQASARGAELGHAAYGLAKAQAGRSQDLALLSLAFAALLAGNLAFWRHLRRVYASPRRSVWRRG